MAGDVVGDPEMGYDYEQLAGDMEEDALGVDNDEEQDEDEGDGES